MIEESSSSLLAAANWVSATMTGTIALAAGILAIAAIGLTMLQGRTDHRRAASATIGIFLIVSAAQIADVITDIAQPSSQAQLIAPNLPNLGPQANPSEPQTAKLICWTCGQK